MNTQMSYAKKGVFTTQMQEVAKKQVSEDFLLENIAKGRLIWHINLRLKPF